MLELILAGVVGAAGVQDGPFATVDAEPEGLKGPRFVSGGVVFSNVNMATGVRSDGRRFGPGELGSQVIVERAVALADDVPLFISLPNAITFGESFVPGDGAGLGLLASVTMGAPGTWRFGGLDFIYETGPEWSGTELVLEALLENKVVGRTSYFTAGGEEFPSGGVAGTSMLIKAAAFDSLRLSAVRDGGYAAVPAMIDNVFLVAPAPGALALAGAACAAGAGRRRI